MEHPVIERMERTGYPWSDKREAYGTDGLGNEVHSGDEILRIDDEFYLVEELAAQTIKVLEIHGAVYNIAK